MGEKVRFKRLGLIIVDEEHRFGVRQKERLKVLRAEADILTLTATPIPRTLAMSLDGIRDYSIIATAPEKRLAIKTFVRRETDELIRQAVLRELKRGGQVYFLHNAVETIENRFARLKSLLPEARIGLAHGQMPERDLQVAMRAFYEQRYNVLLCSTIIENGIDKLARHRHARVLVPYLIDNTNPFIGQSVYEEVEERALLVIDVVGRPRRGIAMNIDRFGIPLP